MLNDLLHIIICLLCLFLQIYYYRLSIQLEKRIKTALKIIENAFIEDNECDVLYNLESVLRGQVDLK